jgi:hypothetical protein
MANLKLRGVRESANSMGVTNGPKQPDNIGETSIANTPYWDCHTPRRESGPCKQPNSSLGAKQHPAPVHGRKA